MLKLIFSLLKGIKKFGSYVKVNPLPLLIGFIFAGLMSLAQSQEIIVINLQFLANQTLLDSVCASYGVCLSISQGVNFITSTLFGAMISITCDKFYIAESPNHAWLVSANDIAKRAVNAADTIGGIEVKHEYPANEK